MAAIAVREQELPYNPIVALNAGGSVLHYQVLEAHTAARPSLAADRCGRSVCRGYAWNITRTYAFDDPDFALLIGKMDEVQQTLCAGVRAGVDWRDLHLTAHRLIAGLGDDSGIITLDAEAAVDSGL